MIIKTFKQKRSLACVLLLSVLFVMGLMACSGKNEPQNTSNQSTPASPVSTSTLVSTLTSSTASTSALVSDVRLIGSESWRKILPQDVPEHISTENAEDADDADDRPTTWTPSNITFGHCQFIKKERQCDDTSVSADVLLASGTLSPEYTVGKCDADTRQKALAVGLASYKTLTDSSSDIFIPVTAKVAGDGVVARVSPGRHIHPNDKPRNKVLLKGRELRVISRMTGRDYYTGSVYSVRAPDVWGYVGEGDLNIQEGRETVMSSKLGVTECVQMTSTSSPNQLVIFKIMEPYVENDAMRDGVPGMVVILTVNNNLWINTKPIVIIGNYTYADSKSEAELYRICQTQTDNLPQILISIGRYYSTDYYFIDFDKDFSFKQYSTHSNRGCGC